MTSSSPGDWRSSFGFGPGHPAGSLTSPATTQPEPLVRIVVRIQTWPNWRSRPPGSRAALSAPSGAPEHAALTPRGASHLLRFLSSRRALQAGLRPHPATCLSSAAASGASRLLHTAPPPLPSDGEPLPASHPPERSADVFWLAPLAPAFARLRAYAFQSFLIFHVLPVGMRPRQACLTIPTGRQIRAVVRVQGAGGRILPS